MDEREANQLVRQIESEPGWHAVAHRNVWSGLWRVQAWPDAMVEPDTGEPGDWYTFEVRSSWYRLRMALHEEAREAAAGVVTPGEREE